MRQGLLPAPFQQRRVDMNLLALAVSNQSHSIGFHQFVQGTIQRGSSAQVAGDHALLHSSPGYAGCLFPPEVVEQPAIQMRRIGLGLEGLVLIMAGKNSSSGRLGNSVWRQMRSYGDRF